MHDYLYLSVHISCCCVLLVFFFFNDTATTEIYTLSLHDALPILVQQPRHDAHRQSDHPVPHDRRCPAQRDRKSTRLNSSHGSISYAVFCLKKKKKKNQTTSNNIIYTKTIIHTEI